MCISNSVGLNTPNNFDDVVVVQTLLNLSRGRTGAAATLATDGAFGTNTRQAIEAFQRIVMSMAAPDGRVDPASATLRELRAGIPAEFSQAKMQGIMPRAKGEDVTKYFPALQSTMLDYEINTSLRQAHFLAQIGHESGALKFTQELASGEAYEGRSDLGNTQPGDGKKFKGRGLIQLTGRANYEKYGAAKGRSFVDGDSCLLLATDPQLAVDVSCWFWKTHGLNALADTDDVRAVTKRINGGLNGLENREAHLTRARFFLLTQP